MFEIDIPTSLIQLKILASFIITLERQIFQANGILFCAIFQEVFGLFASFPRLHETIKFYIHPPYGDFLE